MEQFPVLCAGCLLIPSRSRGTEGPAHLTTLSFGMEALPPLEDQSFCLAPRTMMPDDEGTTATDGPNSPADCPLCAGALEDSSHLFFICPLAQVVWQVANVGRLGVSSEEAFWRSLIDGPFRREVEW